MKKTIVPVAATLAVLTLLGASMPHFQSTPSKGKGGRFSGHGASGDWRDSVTKEPAQAGQGAAAYKVARHHLAYPLDDYSLDEAQAIIFLRLATKCPNANAYTGLISLLAAKPAHDAEVDNLLRELAKLDPRKAGEAKVHVSIKRLERSQQ